MGVPIESSTNRSIIAEPTKLTWKSRGKFEKVGTTWIEQSLPHIRILRRGTCIKTRKRLPSSSLKRVPVSIRKPKKKSACYAVAKVSSRVCGDQVIHIYHYCYGNGCCGPIIPTAIHLFLQSGPLLLYRNPSNSVAAFLCWGCMPPLVAASR